MAERYIHIGVDLHVVPKYKTVIVERHLALADGIDALSVISLGDGVDAKHLELVREPDGFRCIPVEKQFRKTFDMRRNEAERVRRRGMSARQRKKAEKKQPNKRWEALQREGLFA